ncbi:SH3 domain-containing protein [Robiginitomaculum antarcticum]|uniref:SH3 domain-containing protein n=1 Tax=Robiginitomaculum antarcticum TaxID=437507 RepID=UPI000362A2C7|nr:SH3 domain-containing protein [Robiginitomaculum antarcticum]
MIFSRNTFIFITFLAFGVFGGETGAAQTTPAATPQQAISAPTQRVMNVKTPAKLNMPNFSGYPLPRYVSLRHNRSYGRSGPSREHAIAWVYERKGLPMIVVAETEVFRKVRDLDGDETWMHKSQLVGRRSAVALQDTTFYVRPRETAKIRVITAKNTILFIENCDQIGWCKVESKTGHKGYVKSRSLWGVAPLR